MKNEVMQTGFWKDTRTNNQKSHVGFHLNSLYSPFVSFGDVAVEFVKANKSIMKHEAIRNFNNSWLAITHSDVGQETSENDIHSIIDLSYRRGEIPENTNYIVMGGDAGQNASHWVASAVCADGQIKVIDWGELLSYSSANGHFGYHELVKTKKWYSQKNDWQIDIAFIDSGYSTQEIYAECMRGINGQLNPTKGSNKAGVWGETQVRTHDDLTLYTYSDYALKMYLHNAIKDKQISLPADADKDLLKGLSGQQVIFTKSGQRQWKELKNDHYNDCLKLCVFCTWVNPL